MNKFNVGDIVNIANTNGLYTTHRQAWNLANLIPKYTWVSDTYPSKQGTFVVVRILPEDGFGACIYVISDTKTNQCYLFNDLHGSLVLKTPKKTPKKPKPTVKITASGRRQFDTLFKLTIVRKAAKIAAKGVRGNHGKLRAMLKSYNVNYDHLYYWRKQHAQGHFSAERAIAFSRKDVMIHG